MIKELHARTVARAVSYRILAIISSLLLLNPVSALIVEANKTLVYYVIERLWLRIKWGVTDKTETQIRVIVRAIVYRIVATIFVSFWVGLNMAIILAIIQTVLYYINEQVWLYVKWGREYEC